MVNWEIREATLDDVPSIVAMVRMGIKEKAFHNREVSDESFLDWAFTNRERGYALYLCENDSESLGYIDSIVGRWGVGFITGIYVNPQYRKQGIGEGLMKKSHDRFLERDCHKARLEVFADNKGAISFYSRVGFVEEGYLQNDEDKRDVIIMSRFLG